MKNDDAQLIQRVLAGDDTAFSVLVKKYQKFVHALAWRKIGDFHIAEDITQDTFLKAYQRLSTLEGTTVLCGLALCHNYKPVQSVAPKKANLDAVVGKYEQHRFRKQGIF